MDRPTNNASSNIYALVAIGGAIALSGAIGCTQVQSEISIPKANAPATSQAKASPTSRNPDFQTVTVLKNLEHPWGIAWLPEGDLLITERSGRLRIARDGVLDPTPIPGVPNVFAQSQGGLMDIALHPRFEENRLVYFTYSHGTSSANRPPASPERPLMAVP